MVAFITCVKTSIHFSRFVLRSRVIPSLSKGTVTKVILRLAVLAQDNFATQN